MTDHFLEVSQLVLGPGAPISKKDRTEREKFERRQAQVGLASNVVGIAAGVAGTREAYKGFKQTQKPKGRHIKVKPIKITGKTKALAAGALGLQVANLAGDAVANRVLARGAKKKDDVKKSLILKSSPTGSDLHCVGMGGKQGKLKPLPKSKKKPMVSKSVTFEGEISKVNVDKRQVFGWASIVELNGEPVVDLQGDYIDIDEVEKSAYEYVIKSRKGGDMHRRNGEEAFHASDMIESFIVTPEKKEKLGLPDDMPIGWWVGYQVNDPDAWELVKSGKRTGFSIHGRGMRTPTEI